MSYLKSTSSIFQTPPPYSLAAFQPPMWSTLLYAKPTVWRWSHGVAAQSGATATLATATWYMITDHRHAPSTQHNSSTDKRLQFKLLVCLPTSDKAGCRTFTCASKQAFYKPHRVWRSKSHPPESPLLLFLSPTGVEATKFSLPQANTIVSLWQLRFEHFLVCTPFVQLCVHLCLCAEQLGAGVSLPLSTV